MRRIITLSVSENPTYAWFVPLCTLMWREVAGYEVSCIFVGPVDPWLLDRAREIGTRVHEVHGLTCCSTPTASQIIRLFSYALPDVEPGDYLMSVDADAWPLARAFEPSGAPLDLLYPDACDRAETPYFPIGYIGAKASAWREFMGIEAPTARGGLEDLFRTDPLLTRGHTGWNYDETMVTRKIKAWGLQNVRAMRRRGDPPIDRIDRAAWPAVPDRRGKIDAHLIRPGWTPENWPRLRPLLAQCLSAESLAWADTYCAEWCKQVYDRWADSILRGEG